MSSVLEEALALQEASWQPGRKPVYVEGLVEAYPDLGADVDALFFLYRREIAFRNDRGEFFDPNEYRGRACKLLASLRHSGAVAGDLDLEEFAATNLSADSSLPWSNFDVIETLKADGPMGLVLLAYQKDLKRGVVLKVLPDFGSGTGPHELLQREPFILAQADLLHIVRVFGAGVRPEDGRVFFAMEYLAEGSLARPENLGRFQGRPVDAVLFVLKLARTLGVIHARGLAHNDIKPANILLDAEGNPKFGDFGLSGPAGGDAGICGGTDGYNSPEKARRLAGEPFPPGRPDVDFDPRKADVYSLGLVLYELLSGTPAVTRDDRDAQRTDPDWRPAPVRRSNDRVSADIEAVCLKALANDPARRYTAEQFAEQLARAGRGEETDARRWSARERFLALIRRHPLMSLVLLGLFAAATLAGLVGSWWKESSDRAEQLRHDRYWSELRGTTRSLEIQDLVAARHSLHQAIERGPRESDLRGVEWGLLAGLLEGHEVKFSEGRSSATGLACGGDGKLLAAGFADGSVILWDAETRRHLRTLTSNLGAALHLSFAPDGRSLVCGYGVPLSELSSWPSRPTCAVLRWDLETGQSSRLLDGNPLAVLAGTSRRACRVVDLVYDPDEVPVVRVLAGNGEMLGRMTPDHMNASNRPVVLQAAISPDGRFLAAAIGSDSSPLLEVVVLAIEGASSRVVHRGTEPLFDLRFDPLSRYVVWSVGGRYGYARVSGGGSGGGDGTCLGFLHDGSDWILTRGPSESLRRQFDPDSLRSAAVQAVVQCAARPASWEFGSNLVPLLAHRFGTDPANVPAESALNRGHRGGVKVRQLAPNGQTLWTGGRDGTVNGWCVGTGVGVRSRRLGADTVRSRLSPDGGLVATESPGGQIRLWRYPYFTPIETTDGPMAGTPMCFDPSGTRLAASLFDTVGVFDTRTGAVCRLIRRAGEDPACAAFAPDGKSVCVGTRRGQDRHGGVQPPAPAERPGGDNGALSVWDLEAGDGPPVEFRFDAPVTASHYAPTGRQLVVAATPTNTNEPQSQLYVADLANGSVTRLGEVAGRVSGFCFSPDGRRLAVGTRRLPGLTQEGTDGKVQEWDWPGRRLVSEEPHPGGIFGLAYAADGRRLITVGHERGTRAEGGGVTVWATGAGPRSVDLPSHPWVLTDVAVLPDREEVVVLNPFGHVSRLGYGRSSER